MRKLIIYLTIFMCICFIIPVLITKTREIQKTKKIEAEEPSQIDHPKDYTKIKLLHLKDNTVEELDLDKYLYGVVSAEMPASYELEALKAQAVVARTYTIYNMEHSKKHENADICDTSTCCQAYITKEKRLEKWNEKDREANWAKIVNAVDSTSGEIITYNGEPINALFHANSGGTTELPSNVWGGGNYPYLQTIATSGEEGYRQYSSTLTLTKEELIKKLKAVYPDILIDFKKEDEIKILELTESGRVRTIKFGNKEISGVETRKIFGLKSANFNVNVSGNITFNVIGYGHGVGMSQTGADSLAKANKNYKEIIKHFYSNVEIQRINQTN